MCACKSVDCFLCVTNFYCKRYFLILALSCLICIQCQMSTILNYSFQNWNKVSTGFLNYLSIQHLDMYFSLYISWQVLTNSLQEFSQNPMFTKDRSRTPTNIKDELLGTILKLKTFGCIILLQIASSMLLLVVIYLTSF